MGRTRRFIDAPDAVRCRATIRLRDGSAAQCGRRQVPGFLCCWQHLKTENVMSETKPSIEEARERQLSLRVSLPGMLSNAADVLNDLAHEIRRLKGYDPEDETADDPAADADVHVFLLREAARHARATAAGEHTVEEFAEFYCLKERA